MYETVDFYVDEVPVYLDLVFWIVFAILNFFWFAGFLVSYKKGWATPRQMTESGKHGMCWMGHFGFWYLLFVLQPTLAWATAKMWPLWEVRGGWIAICMMLGLLIMYAFQTKWSMDAVSSDAWSTDCRPNEVGILHIVHGTPEVAIMLMLVVSKFWFKDMSWTLFLGLLGLVLVHFYIGGTHWMLRWWSPEWRPKDKKQLTDTELWRHIGITGSLFGYSLMMLAKS